MNAVINLDMEKLAMLSVNLCCPFIGAVYDGIKANPERAGEIILEGLEALSADRALSIDALTKIKEREWPPYVTPVEDSRTSTKESRE